MFTIQHPPKHHSYESIHPYDFVNIYNNGKSKSRKKKICWQTYVTHVFFFFTLFLIDKLNIRWHRQQRKKWSKITNTSNDMRTYWSIYTLFDKIFNGFYVCSNHEWIIPIQSFISRFLLQNSNHFGIYENIFCLTKFISFHYFNYSWFWIKFNKFWIQIKLHSIRLYLKAQNNFE